MARAIAQPTRIQYGIIGLTAQNSLGVYLQRSGCQYRKLTVPKSTARAAVADHHRLPVVSDHGAGAGRRAMLIGGQYQWIGDTQPDGRSLAAHLPQSSVYSGEHRRSSGSKTDKKQRPGAGAQEKSASHGAAIITAALQNELTFR